MATGEAFSRKGFVRGLAGGGATALLAGLAGCGGGDEGKGSGGASPAGAEADGRRGDIDILNFAFALELLERDFYRQVLDSGQIKQGRVLELVKEIGSNEEEHVEVLQASIKKLGGTPSRPAPERFDDVIEGGPDYILDTAASIENLGAGAYLGQAAAITDKDVLAAALSIHSVEARHAAALNELAGRGFEGGEGSLEGSIPDGPFARPITMSEALEVVRSVVSNASR